MGNDESKAPAKDPEECQHEQQKPLEQQKPQEQQKRHDSPKQQERQKPQQEFQQHDQQKQQEQQKPQKVQQSPSKTLPVDIDSSPPPQPQSSPKITGPKVEKKGQPPPPELQVMVVGLDNAGKSSILSRMKANKAPKDIAPTAGFQVERFQKGKTNLTVYDMAGATSYRNLWDDNLKGCQVLVFVVDSADKFRIVVAREELEILIGLPDMESVPVLVFANKNDLPNALNYSKVSEQMGLEEIADRSWNIVSSSAVTGAGIQDGIDWILKNYKKKD